MKWHSTKDKYPHIGRWVLVYEKKKYIALKFMGFVNDIEEPVKRIGQFCKYYDWDKAGNAVCLGDNMHPIIWTYITSPIKISTPKN